MSMTQTINTLRAHKAINLATELSNAQKQVLGTLVDHYNHRTGQCDPSLDCLAELIVMSRRTAIRAIAGVEKLGFVRKVRHGGKFHRNQYQIIWSRFAQVELDWNHKRAARSKRFGTPKLSPCPSQRSHIAGDTAGTQTSSNNLSNVTLPEKKLLAKAPPSHLIKESGSARKGGHRDFIIDGPHLNRSAAASSTTAARDSAERRWNIELQNRYVGEPNLYGQIIEAVDAQLVGATTDAELVRRGSGLSYLMNELLARDAAFKASAISRPTPQGGIKSLRP
jgi:hypothetical protein